MVVGFAFRNNPVYAEKRDFLSRKKLEVNYFVLNLKFLLSVPHLIL